MGSTEIDAYCSEQISWLREDAGILRQFRYNCSSVPTLRSVDIARTMARARGFPTTSALVMTAEYIGFEYVIPTSDMDFDAQFASDLGQPALDPDERVQAVLTKKRPCERCKKPFLFKRSTARFCSERCRKYAQRHPRSINHDTLKQSMAVHSRPTR